MMMMANVSHHPIGKLTRFVLLGWSLSERMNELACRQHSCSLTGPRTGNETRLEALRQWYSDRIFAWNLQEAKTFVSFTICDDQLDVLNSFNGHRNIIKSAGDVGNEKTSQTEGSTAASGKRQHLQHRYDIGRSTKGMAHLVGIRFILWWRYMTPQGWACYMSTFTRPPVSSKDRSSQVENLMLKIYLRDECGESSTDRCIILASPMASGVLLVCLRNTQLTVFCPTCQARLEAERWSLWLGIGLQLNKSYATNLVDSMFGR